jgi:tetratricopeptide (TPR) repeat protein/DNA-binding winged helix-turn-helix (wHTH) protein
LAPALYRIRDANLEVRPDLGCLRRPTGEEIYLRPKTFHTLLLLLELRHRVVTKDEIASRIWPDTAVTDDAVVQCIVELRKGLGDDAKQAQYIRTLPKSGYRFVGEVDEDIAMEAVEDAAVVEPIEAPRPAVAVARASDRRPLIISLGVAGALVLFVVFSLAYSRSTDADAAAGLVDRIAVDARSRPTIAVMFLDNQSQTAELDWLREGLVDMLVTGMSRSQGLSVVGRQQLDLLLDRVGHRRGASVTLPQAVNAARRAELDHVVLGSFAKLGNTIRIDLRVHDRTGRMVDTEALTIDTPDDLLRQVDLLSWRLAAHFGQSTPTSVPAAAITTNLEAYRYYSLGVSRANSYRSLEAIELFTRATELDPQFALAFGRIGYAYGVVWNQMERARPFLAKAYQLSSRMGELERLQIESWNAIVHLDYEAAEASLEKLIRAYPLEVEAYTRLGVLLGGERRYDEAIRVFRRGLAIDPESPDLWNRIGGLYDGIGQSSDGIAARRKYVALQPLEPNAHDSLGLSLATAGQYEPAIESYRRALDLKPDFDVALIHLGNAMVQTGRYKEGDEAFRRYIAVASSRDEADRGYLSLAASAYQRGRVREALTFLRRAPQPRLLGLDFPVRLDAGEPIDRVAATLEHETPLAARGGRMGDRVSHYARGVLALRRGAGSDAIAHFRAALLDHPLSFHVESLEDCLGNAYLALGKWDEAIAEFQRILGRNPRFPRAHFRLAQAFEGKGETTLARQAYTQFLEVWSKADPDVPDVITARARLNALTNPSQP